MIALNDYSLSPTGSSPPRNNSVSSATAWGAAAAPSQPSLWNPAPGQRRPSVGIDASNIWSTAAHPTINLQDAAQDGFAASRRHSHNDVYSYNMQPPQAHPLGAVAPAPAPAGILPVQAAPASQPGPSQPSHPRHSPRDLHDLHDASTLQLVNDYFERDPHQRVKVTARLLADRFFDEEKYLSDAYQLPRFPIENSLRNYQLVLVGFKAGRVDVFYLPSVGQHEAATTADLHGVKVGDLVIVEADRGRDLGKIVKMNISIDEARLMKLLQFQEQQAALSDKDDIDEALSVRGLSTEAGASGSSSASPPTLHFPKSILSLAQPSEIAQVLNKKQDEEKACRLCLAKIANATGHAASASNSDLLQMKLIDAEYQFDRKKLIFYYSTSKRIDFRDLVRELFRIYKTRIWMCAVVGLPYVPARNTSKVSPVKPTVQIPQTQVSPAQATHTSMPQASPNTSHPSPQAFAPVDRRFSYHSGMPVPPSFQSEQVIPRFAGEQQHQTFQHIPQPNMLPTQYGAPATFNPVDAAAHPFSGQQVSYDSRRNSAGDLWSANYRQNYNPTDPSWNDGSGATPNAPGGGGYVLQSLVESMDN